MHIVRNLLAFLCDRASLCISVWCLLLMLPVDSVMVKLLCLYYVGQSTYLSNINALKSFPLSTSGKSCQV